MKEIRIYKVETKDIQGSSFLTLSADNKEIRTSCGTIYVKGRKFSDVEKVVRADHIVNVRLIESCYEIPKDCTFDVSETIKKKVKDTKFVIKLDKIEDLDVERVFIKVREDDPEAIGGILVEGKKSLVFMFKDCREKLSEQDLTLAGERLCASWGASFGAWFHWHDCELPDDVRGKSAKASQIDQTIKELKAAKKFLDDKKAEELKEKNKTTVTVITVSEAENSKPKMCLIKKKGADKYFLDPSCGMTEDIEAARRHTKKEANEILRRAFNRHYLEIVPA